MTRIRDWIINLRTKRANIFSQSDSVSFDAFSNDGSGDHSPKIKESSLIRTSVSQPNKPKNDNYERFSAAETDNTCSRPSLVSILLLTLLIAVFIVLPIVYLLHCFDLLHSHWAHVVSSHRRFLEDEVHYSPGSKVHELLKVPHSIINPTEYPNNVKDANASKILPPPPKPDYTQCKKQTDDNKFDCYPENGASKSACEARGCCWIPRSNIGMTDKLDVPYCFYPLGYGGYKYLNVTKTGYGLNAYLKRVFKSPYPKDANIIKIIVKFENENRLKVKIVDAENNRFESPYPEVPLVDKECPSTLYSFVIDSTKTGFKIVRKSDNSIIFDAIDVGAMIFSDQFLQISARLPSKYIYGLGEHRSNLLLSTQWNRLTMFNLDQLPTENLNLYGSHPIYLSLEPSKNAHGVFLLNSNAMDVILQPAPAVTFRAIGGVLDFYYLLGPTPGDVVQQYTDIVGRPFMPPLWGLGFHLCRYGYKTLNNTRAVWKRTIDAGIPLDVQWNDLDYMDSNNDFTLNQTAFKDLPKFVEELHSMGMYYIPLIDAGISGSEEAGKYPPYDKGIAMDIFIKNSSGLPFIGKVWNTKSTVWPDFTNPYTLDYWTTMIRLLHDVFPFDGAWIDMNEPSNFLSGSTTGCPVSPLENPPYLPGVHGGQMNYKTMCMTSQQYAGLHYDVHNLFGLSEAIMTSFAMAEIRGKRPFVISRSSFSSLGHFSGHWSGDVYSTWKDMKFTIPEMLSFSIFGIPLMGADICGFNGNSTAALCQRWMQLGAFYPFSRNHNTDDGIDQDPVAFGPDVVNSSRKALNIRYSLISYLYTLFWKAHIDGDTVARPLFFEFVNDANTYDIDDQFLWGSSLLICPVLDENQVTLSPYLPHGKWYDFYTCKEFTSFGARFNISAPLDTIPLFVRGGSVITMQTPASNTQAMRKSSVQLLASPDVLGQGSGHLYWDDGDSLNSPEELKYSLLNFTLQIGELRSNVMWSSDEKIPNLGRVTILGVSSPISSVTVNGDNPPFSYNTINKFLLIDNLNVTLMKPVVVEWK